jgi:hypothetical protein
MMLQTCSFNWFGMKPELYVICLPFFEHGSNEVVGFHLVNFMPKAISGTLS